MTVLDFRVERVFDPIGNGVVETHGAERWLHGHRQDKGQAVNGGNPGSQARNRRCQCRRHERRDSTMSPEDPTCGFESARTPC